MAQPAGAAEIKVLTTGAFKQVVVALVPEFEKATGHKVVLDNGTVGQLQKRVDGGEAFDVLVLSPKGIEDYIKAGKIVAGSNANLAKVGVGVMVKEGAPKPDISSVEAFKQALLKAKSVTYLKEGASTIHLRKLFVQLGIADAVKAKAVETDGEMVSELVAEGKVELGLIVVPNIMSVPGAELVGPLPKEINSIVMFTAAVSAASPNREAARQLIKLLKSPEAKPVIQAKGNDPA